MKIDDLNKIGQLVGIYELDPTKTYIAIFDGKHFDIGLANSLFRHIRESNVEMELYVVASLYPEKIKIHEATKE